MRDDSVRTSVSCGSRARRAIIGAMMTWLLGAATSAEAATVTLYANDMGWYDAGGTHTASNTNYLAGEGGFPGLTVFRNFFVFYSFEISGTVNSATLRVFNPTNGVLTPDPFETYTLYDVTTSEFTLRGGGSGLTAVYDDLGSGVEYGSVNISEADENSVISIPLNAAAVARIQQGLGWIFMVGGAVTTLGSAGGESVFAFTTDVMPLPQLVLELSNVCGDGIREGSEECDDGNFVNDDCCAFCHVTPDGSPCRSDGLVCTRDVCAAAVCTHPPTPAGTECRGAAGVCDLAETCDGVATVCPADAKRTDECRGAAGACDVSEVCDGAGDDCPADALAPSTTVCRAAAGDCDVVETCGGGVDCPADLRQADGTTCDDGDACTQSDACNAGACLGGDPLDCDDGNACTRDSCTPAAGCLHDAAPRNGCRSAQRSLLQLKRRFGATDALVWKWSRGDELSRGELADPTASSDYALCLYGGAADTLLLDAGLDAGGKWSALGSAGFRYSDANGAPDGIRSVQAKAGLAGKSKLLVKGRGGNLPDVPSAALVPPVRAQLVNLEGGLCLESVYDAGDVVKSTDAQFKARTR